MRLIIILFWIPILVSAQEYEEIIDWSGAGLNQDTKNNQKEIEFDRIKEQTLNLNDDEVLEKIFQDYPEGGVIIFGASEYNFYSQIKLVSNFVLRGYDKDETKFNFKLKTEQDLIFAGGRAVPDQYLIKKSIQQGDNVLFADTSSLQKGDWIQIADNDDSLVFSSWSRRKTGQIVQVVGIENGRVELGSSLRRDYQISNSPYFVKLKMVENVGIENLTIVNLTKTKSQTSNIQFRYVNNCWVDNIKSVASNYAHVLLEFSSNCLVKNSEFEKGQDYGNGGKAYGVALQFATSECLIKKCHFSHLRHSILLQAGANGNVIFKNVSVDPHWEGVILPKNSAGDMVLHGNYPYANLFAYNKFETLVIDNSHGVNGPHNLFLSNEFCGYGIFMNRKSSVGGMSFIKNVCSNQKMMKGRYKIRGKNHIEMANEIKGKILPKKTQGNELDYTNMF